MSTYVTDKDELDLGDNAVHQVDWPQDTQYVLTSVTGGVSDDEGVAQATILGSDAANMSDPVVIGTFSTENLEADKPLTLTVNTYHKYVQVDSGHLPPDAVITVRPVRNQWRKSQTAG